ncbi:MAG: ArsR/SmtB family transcription factor [Candidatus Woesearchaeota archaeon]
MQEIPEIFSPNKWPILKALAEKERSATELSEMLETSISNVTQQLKLLEAYSLVTKKKSEQQSIGKPRTIYTLKEEFVYAAILKKGYATKKIFKLEGFSKLIYNLLFIVGPEDSIYVLRFMLKNEEILKKCKALGFIKSTKETVELFILTDHVDEIRARFSNQFIEDMAGKTKKIINWTHNEWEMIEGFKRKEKYFLDMAEVVEIIYDTNNALREVKRKRNTI